MKRTLIHNAHIINEGRSFRGAVLIVGEKIDSVAAGAPLLQQGAEADETVDAGGRWLIPGAIDDQVHFREPGLTHKGDIRSEGSAAVAGGVTTFMDMPNTLPQTTTAADLEWKLSRAAETSPANYSFFFGGTNTNWDEVCRIDRSRVPGLKLFLGSSTGNMLVDNAGALERIFRDSGLLIAIHAEKESVIRKNIAYYTQRYGPSPDVRFHPLIRDAEACYASSSEAVELALRTGARLHILHLSTARELSLLDGHKPLAEKQITGEVCIHHLWFCDEDYATYGNRIKWNPSIKSAVDREALRQAVRDNVIDIVATDHAPHLLSEKEGGCLTAASGGPLVQHSVLAMWEMAANGIFSFEQVVAKMSHHPAELFHIRKRGYIRPGYYADLTLVEDAPTPVTKESLHYKCAWSPFEGHTFPHKIWRTYVNGQPAYINGQVNPSVRGKEVEYD